MMITLHKRGFLLERKHTFEYDVHFESVSTSFNSRHSFRSLADWPPEEREDLKKVLAQAQLQPGRGFAGDVFFSSDVSISWADAMEIVTWLPRPDIRVSIMELNDDVWEVIGPDSALEIWKNNKLSSATWNVGKMKVKITHHRGDSLGWQYHLDDPGCPVKSLEVAFELPGVDLSSYTDDQMLLARDLLNLLAIIDNTSVTDLHINRRLPPFPTELPVLMYEMWLWGQLVRRVQSLQSLKLEFTKHWCDIQIFPMFPNDLAGPIFRGLASGTGSLRSFHIGFDSDFSFKQNDGTLVPFHPVVKDEWTNAAPHRNSNLQECSMKHNSTRNDMPYSMRLACELNKATNGATRTREHWMEVIIKISDDLDFLHYVLRRHPELFVPPGRLLMVEAEQGELSQPLFPTWLNRLYGIEPPGKHAKGSDDDPDSNFGSLIRNWIGVLRGGMQSANKRRKIHQG